ncbi:hypothetical protein HUT06_42820 [Actinomadura sp. NAK00032]|uniref:hypothetical protein n=1 Tax=Actinomadura sp. NAK00032 TaxID=2742128 RepID=UPI0015909F8C|nr:hypothetical protein [Actinomadura sp. NAK00032]QKW39942.1 hypothetical protein HUT06_42820 [Actinomadura sp. NAK00032]
MGRRHLPARTDWDNGRAQGEPRHHEVVTLGLAAEKEHLNLDLWTLLQITGFEYIESPLVAKRDHWIRELAKLTLELQDADSTDLTRTVEAAQRAFRAKGEPNETQKMLAELRRRERDE